LKPIIGWSEDFRDRVLAAGFKFGLEMRVKTSKYRVAALRKRAAAIGLKRREIYSHEDDWPAIKALAEYLIKRREKAAKVADNANLTITNFT
jgi:hypothetical protein